MLEDRLKNFAKLGYKSADEAVLALKVCDPACGSGHFLIAAAQRIGKVEVDHGDTDCKTPDAVSYIKKSLARKSKRVPIA